MEIAQAQHLNGLSEMLQSYCRLQQLGDPFFCKRFIYSHDFNSQGLTLITPDSMIPASFPLILGFFRTGYTNRIYYWGSTCMIEQH
jgi:hypothetical protein